MNKLIKNGVLSMMFIAGLILIGCKSPEAKIDDAKENVAEAKKDLNEAKAEAVKVVNEEEWTIFKNETELAIQANEKRLADLKAEMKSAGKKASAAYQEQMDKIEFKTKELRERVAGYEKTRSDWESFKREFNHDMDELGNALKDLTVNNKQ